MSVASSFFENRLHESQIASQRPRTQIKVFVDQIDKCGFVQLAGSVSVHID